MDLVTSDNKPVGSRISGEVAIIGMACMFPGAPNIETFWQNIINKVDAITDPPLEAWDEDIFFDPNSTANDRVYCRRGGYLGPLAKFNPLEYGIMPVGLDGGEPDQWLALKVAYDALTDANYQERLKNNQAERNRTAVILGKGNYLNRGNLSMVQHSLVVDQTLQILQVLHPEYNEADLDLIRQELKKKLPPFNSEAAPGLVPNIVASRIANRLDLMGPTYTIDAACASSLIALEAGTRYLLTDQCDLALVGGVQVTTPIPILTLFCQLNALSRQQEIRPFDKDADGTILGEGIGIIILKRHEDAVRDGDRIYALVKGVGTASDGRAMSVLAPRVEGAELALQRAYDIADISPKTIGLIEAHGTSTRAGDLMEIRALWNVFGKRNGLLPHCALGSIKSMIGHTLPAAGIAGVIKAALALHHKVLPPTLHCDEPNPEFGLDQTVFYINTETRPWIHSADGKRTPRRAGVNAFGFGGINAHAILEENPDSEEMLVPSHLRRWDSEVIVLEADSRELLVKQAQALQAYMAASSNVELLDVAYTINSEVSAKPYRLSFVANSPLDLQQKLAQAVQRLAEPGRHQIKDVKGIYFFETSFYPSGKLAFLFPGEGSQYSNMLSDLCLHFPDVRACFDRIDQIFLDHPRRYLPSDFIFPRPTFPSRRDAEQHLWQVDVAIEAVLTANQALFTLLSRLGVQPDAVVGHSTGEYSALRAAGVVPLSDKEFIEEHLLDLNRVYNEQAAQERDVPRAVLLAVGAGLDRVSPLLEQVDGEIYIGMDNCLQQIVIIVEKSAIDAVTDLMRSQGLIYELLPFDRAYHTPLFAAYSQSLYRFFERLPLSLPKTRLYSCTTAAPFPDDIDQIRALVMEHWISPVRFRETIQTMYADGIRLFVEVGARGTLTSFVDDILRKQPHLAFPANAQHRSGLSQLNHLLGLLCAQGVPMCLDYLYQRRNPQRLSLTLPSCELSSTETQRQQKPDGTLKLATGWAGMEISPEIATQLRQSVSKQASSMAQGNDRVEQKQDKKSPISMPHQALRNSQTQVMQAHLQLLEQFLDVQQTVMQQFLVNSTAPEKDLPFHSAAANLLPGLEEDVLEHRTPITGGEQSHSAPETTEAAGVTETDPFNDLNLEQVQQTLLRLVSDKTGYPIDMLELSTNLEADLGVDSIKRLEILGAFNSETGLLNQQDMNQVSALKTLEEIADFSIAQAKRVSDTPTVSPQPEQSSLPEADGIAGDGPGQLGLPFIRTISSLTPGQELVALCQLDLSEDIFLKDHTLGRSISLEDNELLALPIVPLTISMEILAEAAAYLLPDQKVVGMRNVRAYRWILLEETSVTLQVVAARKPAPNDQEVEVYLREADDGTTAKYSKTPIIEGTIVFASTYPSPPEAPPDTPPTKRPSRWTPDQLYTEGMFHGPTFRAVISVDYSGKNNTVATLQALPTSQLFRSSPDPGFVAEPIILDAAGQLVGFWAMEHLETGFVVFPFRLEALNLYGPPLHSPEKAQCQASIELIDGRCVRSNIDIIGPDRRLRLQLVGWEDKRFDLPGHFYRFLLSPRDVALSESWTTPLNGFQEREAFQCCRVMGFPDEFFELHGELWEKVLAHLILGRTERQIWRRMKGPKKRRVEWLLGRIAVKDAVRLLIQNFYGLTLCPADIDIVTDERGRPAVSGAWLEKLDQPIIISLTHTDGIAVAIAGKKSKTGKLDGLGIDIEQVSRTSQDFESTAFTLDEQAILTEIDEQKNEAWSLRLWCAKEAVGKALGQVLAGGPLGIIIKEINVYTGSVQMNLTGEMARQFPEINGKSIKAHTIREGDFVVASVFNPGE